MKKAFTLIELLVVVLIIGILAAIALPQYQKAVLKSKYVQIQTLASSIWTAEQAYRMANGKWSVDFYALDIQTPIYQEKFATESGKVYSVKVTKDDECFLGAALANITLATEEGLENNLSYIWCNHSPKGVGYRIVPSTGKRYCTALKTDTKATDFCHRLTGNEKETWTDSYDVWEITNL